MNTVDEVLKHALVRPVVPIEWDENAESPAPVESKNDGDADEVVKH